MFNTRAKEIAKEHRKDRLRQAEEHRLIKSAYRDVRSGLGLHERVLLGLGEMLVALGTWLKPRRANLENRSTALRKTEVVRWNN